MILTDGGAYKTQLIVIVLAPSFLAAGINLTLKHIVLSFDVSLSRLKPAQYTWIFIPIDFSCICLQAVGGGLAASAGDTGNMTVLEAGNNIIVTGIVLQVVNLSECSNGLCGRGLGRQLTPCCSRLWSRCGRVWLEITEAS